MLNIQCYGRRALEGVQQYPSILITGDAEGAVVLAGIWPVEIIRCILAGLQLADSTKGYFSHLN